MQRFRFAWDQLAGRRGQHLEIGIGDGELLRELAAASQLELFAVDAHPGYVAAITESMPSVTARHVGIHGPLPFADNFFSSVSMLEVLEHVPDERSMLTEVARVLQPNGLLVLTVPGRHLFSFLDPGNVKYRFPRFHRAVYTARFGGQIYREKFVDVSNGLVGEMSLGKEEHTNYRVDELIGHLAAAGFGVTAQHGANLFWRLFQVPGLLGGRRLRRITDRLTLVDARRFAKANLFVTARRLA